MQTSNISLEYSSSIPMSTKSLQLKNFINCDIVTDSQHGVGKEPPDRILTKYYKCQSKTEVGAVLFWEERAKQGEARYQKGTRAR